jgi:hypothetical protein
MKTIEPLFAKAEYLGLIDKGKVSETLSENQKKFCREIDLRLYEGEFNSWLRNKKNFSWESQDEYSKYLTFELFKEFLKDYKAEKKENQINTMEQDIILAELNKEQVIAMEILGLRQAENNYNPSKPIFNYIPAVLKKHGLSLQDAIFYLLTHTGGLSPDIDTNLKPKVIEYLKGLIEINYTLPPQPNQTKTEQETPKTFEELFYNPEHAEPCLQILSELQPPVIDAINNYIGKAKGVFPLWVKVLKNHKPKPLIKQFKDTVYKDLLNQKVKGLNLTKDASEFRKQYVRLENDKIELDIKAILSQYSQSGRLGK